MSEVVIKIEAVSRIFGKEDLKVTAVDKVSLEIVKGEFSALVGPSGSGKTTLLNLIGGLDQVTSGSIHLAGVGIHHMSEAQRSDFRRDQIGFIFQSFNLIPVLTIEENIEYVMLLQGVSPSERKARVNEMLEVVGLSGYNKRFPHQLSGGQQQRVAVARAMVARPKIILADEPTANLDSKTANKLLDMMSHLNETEQMTFLFSTHDPNVMAKAKRIITLKDGKIESDEKR